MLEDSFSRAQSIGLLTTNNPAFRRFYQAQGTARPRSGFHITASYGMILLPEESQDITEALQLVDRRKVRPEDQLPSLARPPEP